MKQKNCKKQSNKGRDCSVGKITSCRLAVLDLGMTNNRANLWCSLGGMTQSLKLGPKRIRTYRVSERRRKKFSASCLCCFQA
ncbi:hypothetical protein L596_004722 [Steinernema carpocapsae]|uniref:Uncharacterized protein n=1 Tax=Steinernema carpocapsae TaxID=34508 RepID=A0A4U8UWN7_STECR|nr:hypothetical protein L596_004722 [Steinernema carpocapsae]